MVSPSFAAGGQYGQLSGTIVDDVSKSAVSGAKVTIASPSGVYKATSGSNGQFSFNGVVVDTYVLSIEANGFNPFSQNGVTIIGDQANNLGSIAIAKVNLKQIARVSARSVTSAYQPSQTTDSTTISGNRMVETTGKEGSTDEKSLLLAAPGTSVSSNGTVTIRGGLETEIGYQLDGVPFTEPFFNQNASSGLYNGVGSVQIVEGPGDATQGNVGGGVVNTITTRGRYPGDGLLDFEVGGPNYSHQMQLAYGTATKSGNVSDFFSFTGQNFVPYQNLTGGVGYGFSGTDTATLGGAGFYGNSQEVNRSIRNNFVFKFGHNNSQSIQFLYDNEDLQIYGDRGGLQAGTSLPLEYYPYDPSLQANYGVGIGNPNTPDFQTLVPTEPGFTRGLQYPTTAEEVGDNQTSLMKFEYDSNIDPNTFAALKYYNEFISEASANNYGEAGQGSPEYVNDGGQRVGGQLDLTHTFGSRLTVTAHGEYEVQKPQFDFYLPYALLGDAYGGANSVASIVGQCAVTQNVAYAACNAPDYNDFLPGGYVYNALGKEVSIPDFGINYDESTFITSAEALRVRYNPIDRLHFDLGYRRDAEDYKYGCNPLAIASIACSNPDDVNPATIGPSVLHPQVDEPRAAVSLQLDRNDAVRFSYGRSAQFANGQTAGTPSTLYNYSELTKIPAKPGAICTSGATNAVSAPCTSYAQELYYFGDTFNDAPDVGQTLPTIFTNYDFTYQHQFQNGWGMRVTPFEKVATGVPSFSFISETISPTTGQFLGGVFTTNNLGINKTSGIEFGLTTPDKRVGLSGFLTATYQNVLDSTPPLLSGENGLPAITSSSLLLGDVYRAGYVSPFQARLGATYKTSFGLHVTPVLEYDRGYPYTLGNLTASNVPIAGINGNIPQVNFGSGVTAIPGFNSTQGAAAATNYADPALPGTGFSPNISATRGTPQTANAGGVLSRPNLNGNITVEYEFKRSTVGIQILNVSANPYYGVIPEINPYYQPVATGVSGPQTNQVPQTLNSNGTTGATRGYTNIPVQYNAFTNGAYLIPYNTPLHVDVYYQLKL